MATGVRDEGTAPLCRDRAACLVQAAAVQEAAVRCVFGLDALRRCNAALHASRAARAMGPYWQHSGQGGSLAASRVGAVLLCKQPPESVNGTRPDHCQICARAANVLAFHLNLAITSTAHPVPELRQQIPCRTYQECPGMIPRRLEPRRLALGNGPDATKGSNVDGTHLDSRIVAWIFLCRSVYECSYLPRTRRGWRPRRVLTLRHARLLISGRLS